MTNPLRILIADDHTGVHEGLLAMLATQPDFEVVGAARDGVEAVALARDLQPDVTLMDLVMPRLDGLEAIRQIREANSQARILLLTSFADDQRIFPAIRAGALGYLLKDSPRDQLYQAIRDVAQGRGVVHPTIASKILQEIRQPPDQPVTNDPLAPPEVEILRLMAQGLSDHDIAAEMAVDIRTVADYSSSILRKLHLANSTQAALYAQGEGHAN